MPLRCLLFSSNEEMVQPIWQVLTDLGIEGEYCRSAVDAVERVTTQLFQIVITDWEDQPEAAFLLKTARDLKAAHRPLTLAIVSDDARLPEALQAGANSILLRPIRPEQVRDTMSTACELLRSKLPSAAPQPDSSGQPKVKEMAAMAAAAGAASVSAPASVPHVPEKTLRAGEFLQSSSSAPGPQFDTECEVQKSMDHAAAAEVDALTELEPMAAAVVDEPAAAPAERQEALTGWASLQARLTKSAPPAAPEPSAQGELLAYGETPSYDVRPVSPVSSKPAQQEAQPESASEAALFSHISGESEPGVEPGPARPKRSKAIPLSVFAVLCLLLVAMPRTRRSLVTIYGNAAHAGRNWLNPQPVQVPATVTQHESFGQEGDEYKFPVAANIPDATTDPSQIRVLPVVDPTAKPVKASEAGSTQVTSGDNASPEQNPNEQLQLQPQLQNVQPQVVQGQVSQPPASIAGDVAPAPPGGISSVGPAQPNPPATPAPFQKPHATTPAQSSTPPPHAVPSGSDATIPSSLRSQIASMTPEASGAKPLEAAMSSIEPANLPESAAWNLLAQPVDPVYPEGARAAGQRGSVVLQVLIGRDGTVQDAKFLQGSLVFARAAIDAVKQWRFKPYSLNGRAVSVQSLITINFKPPA
jgi:protein TonB